MTTQTEKMEAFFKARPNVWIPRWEVERAVFGGSYRQEISRLRERGLDLPCQKFAVEGLKRPVSHWKLVIARPSVQADLFNGTAA